MYAQKFPRRKQHTEPINAHGHAVTARSATHQDTCYDDMESEELLFRVIVHSLQFLWPLSRLHTHEEYDRRDQDLRMETFLSLIPVVTMYQFQLKRSCDGGPESSKHRRTDFGSSNHCLTPPSAPDLAKAQCGYHIAFSQCSGRLLDQATVCRFCTVLFYSIFGNEPSLSCRPAISYRSTCPLSPCNDE